MQKKNSRVGLITMTSPKKIFYVFSFTILGILTQFFLHAIIEILYIKLLLTNYGVFGLGFEFATWFTIHAVFAVILFVVGIAVGFWQGMYWWKRIYEK